MTNQVSGDRLSHVTKSVGVHQAKTHLSRLLDDVASGEEVVITRRGEPCARLTAIPAGEKRALGIDRGRLVVPDDFDVPLDPAMLDAFES